MITLSRYSLKLWFALGGLVSIAQAAAVTSDLATPDQRRVIVDLAERLSVPPPPVALPADLVQPFNPAAFGQPDPEEVRAVAAANAAAAAANAQAKPSTDHDFLQIIANRVMPSGTLQMGSQQLLIFGQKRLRVGDRLTVSYDNVDYTLELTAVDRTTFTLRLNKDEITRPIRPAKTP
jgi:hypothetical protein